MGTPAETVELAEIELHGRTFRYRKAGKGPLVVLLHGIAGSSATWSNIIPRLSDHHTIIAPDLLGHGASDKPRADYSVAAYANGMLAARNSGVTWWPAPPVDTSTSRSVFSGNW
jgi:pimeloyl-ACP methyl ester carboxylesterase